MRELYVILQSHVITVLFCNTAGSLLRPTHPSTLASSQAISTESLTTKEPSRVPMTTARVQQSATNTDVTTKQQFTTGTYVTTLQQSVTDTHVTTKQQFTTGTYVTTLQQSATDTHVTTYSAHQTTSTLLHHRKTKTGSVAPNGSENKGDDGHFEVHIFVPPY